LSVFRNLSPSAIGIRADLSDAIGLAARHGWQGIDLPIGEAARLAEERGVASVAESFESVGLRLGGWGLPLDWRGGYSQAALAALGEQAALARRLGCVCAYTWVPPASYDLPFRENFDRHVTLLRPIASALDAHGCRLGLEFVGPRTMRDGRRYGFIYSLEGMLCLAQAIGSSAGVLLDSYHWYTSLGTLADIRGLRAEDVVYVHINDAPAGVAVEAQLDQVRRLPGATDVIDLAGFLETLKEIGYDGPVTPEPFEERLESLAPDDACREAHESLLGVWRRAGIED
jgi:sugar phosphate isomerase/epimerase